MQLTEIRGKDTRELRLELQDMAKEFFTLKFKSASEQVAQTSRFKQIRRDRARILTVLGERERAPQESKA